ncbi:hydroxymethylbilane synthase [Brachybacterium hainanense]|uniref:Porphobilinogen deaminase n=1 Tax=Brachybacterium hainanense TaxID=1541174 RepID=A0ABV6RFZ8_9MICO
MTELRPLRLGTRASALALAQSGQAGGEIVAGTGREVELVHVRTRGDVDRTSPLAQIGGTGVFVTAVREALLAGEVDVVVHSCKDLPTLPADGLSLACIPPREDPRDALCAAGGLGLAQLPEGASVGTGSPRRAAQLLRARPDLQIVAIRGNIDTRLARALGSQADLDAVVLAAAGLRRLGKEDAISELLPVEVMLPAPAQGALAIEARCEDVAGAAPSGSGPAWFAPGLARYDDPATRAAVTAERALLRSLEAGCSAPVAAFAEVRAGRLRLRALAIRPDGGHAVEGEASAPLDLASDALSDPASVPARLGAQLAQTLLSRGAGAILEAARQP